MDRSRPLHALAAALEWLVGLRASDVTPLRVTLVFLQWETVSGSAAHAALQHRLSRQALQLASYLVDNRHEGQGVQRREDGVVVLEGDNTVREFSGLQRGVDRARQDGAVPDVWVLANDRYDAYGESSLPQLSAATLRVVAELEALAGKVTLAKAPLSSLGLDLSRWVKTNLIVVAERALARIGGPLLLGEDQLDGAVARSYEPGASLFREGGLVGPLHARQLTAWLTGASDPLFPRSWYRGEPVSATSWPDLRAKVHSCLNEQVFSGRARALGIPLLPLELAQTLGRLGVGNPVVRAELDALNADPEAVAEAVRARRRLPRAVRAALA